MATPIDYSAVLADLEAKRGQIDAAIAVIRALVGSSVTGEGAPPKNGLPIQGRLYPAHYPSSTASVSL
jgi:hypothetical protein